METLGKTSSAWFLEDMFRFANSVEKLPYDHHELMAMVAPRALLVLGNPDYEWLTDESGYISCRAAHEVWKAFGIADRFGFSIAGGHPHCRLPDSQRPEVEAFIDKFLLGKEDVDTSVAKHPFENVEHEYWYDGWAASKSTFPMPDSTNVETFFFEAESVDHGADWQLRRHRWKTHTPSQAHTGGRQAQMEEGTDGRHTPCPQLSHCDCGDAAEVGWWLRGTSGFHR